MTATTELPALTGSEKQIAWATEIRTDRLAAVDRVIAETTTPHILERRIGERAYLRNVTDAGWWIDRRNNIDLQLLQQATREMKAKGA